MFKFLQKRCPASITNKDNQNSTKIHQIRDEIWPLVSLSYEQYCATYIASLEEFNLLYPEVDALPVTINSLKLRRAYIIPTGSRPETAGIDSEQWTFATFITALATTISYFPDRDSAEEFIHKVVPVYALDWLNDDVEKTLIKACCGIDSTSRPLVSITRKAAAKTLSGYDNEEMRFIEWVEQSVTTNSAKINLANSHIHVYDGRFFVLEKLFKRFLAEQKIATSRTLSEEMIRLEPIKFTVIGRKKTRKIKGYLFNSPLIRSLNLPENTVLQQPIGR